MGTSKSISTPAGGSWSPLKRDITSHLGGTPRSTIPSIVGQTVQSAGGLGSLSPRERSHQPGGGRVGSGRASTTRAISRVGGFGAVVADVGLGLALEQLGLSELRDRPAAEVVIRVAEHLSSHADGLEKAILTNALRDTLLEVASLDDNVGYDDLAESLKTFLESNGVEGLVEVFLSNLVYDQVWTLIEQHVHEKSKTNGSCEGLRSSVEAACRQFVRDAVSDLQDSGHFENVDWFGREGANLAQDIVTDIEQRLNKATVKENS